MPLFGTTSPVWLASSTTAQTAEPGRNYFVISILAAQAVFRGRVWEKARRVLVVSKVSMNHPAFGNEPAVRIDCAKEIRNGHAEQLGMAQELVSLTPSTMDRISVVFEFLVDKQNRLEPIASLINDASLLSVMSLSPAVVGGVKAVTKMSTKVLETFLPFSERTPILQFSGDFNLTTGQLREGLFVILATTDDGVSLPDEYADLEFRNGALTKGNAPVTNWSYVVCSVAVVPRRTRALGTGAWVRLLDQAEGAAERIAEDPLAAMPQREKAWSSCVEYFEQARALLLEDPMYLRDEAQEIIREAYASARTKTRGGGVLRAAGATLDERTRRMLGVTNEVDLDKAVASYRGVVEQSIERLRSLGIIAAASDA